MISLRRKIVLILGVMSLVVFAVVPGALAASGCGGTANSALNQYCESLPTARGGQPPRPGTPRLADVLPPSVLRQINRGTSSNPRSALVPLLGLPAAQRHRSVHANPAPATISAGSSLPIWLIVLLAAIALLLAAAAAYRWRRDHSGQEE